MRVNRADGPVGPAELIQALNELVRQAEQADAVEAPVEQFRAWTDVIDALDSARAVVGERRLEALALMRQEGKSYDSIARATGLHKQRIAQLVRDLARRSGDES